VFSALLICCYFIVISSAQTKLEWYVIPMYPFFALLASITVYTVFIWLKDSELINSTLKVNITPYLFLVLVFFTPYRWKVKRIINPKEYKWDVEFYSMAYYLRDAVNGKNDPSGYLLVNDGYAPHHQFYLNALQGLGIPIPRKEKTNLKTNDHILVYQTDVKEYIESNYDVQKIEESEGIIKYRILSSKM